MDYRDVAAEVQRHLLPQDHNFLRSADTLEPALAALHTTWSAATSGLAATGEDIFRAREAAAMLAHGRWAYHAAWRGRKPAACTSGWTCPHLTLASSTGC